MTTVRAEGSVAPGFEEVRREFERNFAERGEAGGALAAYWRGEKVVDLWGGVRNKATGEPWEEDTMVIVYSTTKGLAAMTLALAVRIGAPLRASYLVPEADRSPFPGVRAATSHAAP